MKVRMISNAMVGDKEYTAGREYDIDPITYSTIAQACEKIQDTGENKMMKKGKSLNTKSLEK
jgi:hypothetical protein